MKKPHLSYQNRKKVYGFMFVLPWFAGFLIFFMEPFISSMLYAFQSMTAGPTGFTGEYVGWLNFHNVLFVDTNFVPQLVTSLGELIQIPLIIVYSICFAMLIKNNYRGRTFMRAVAFMPVIISSGVLMQILKEDVFTSSVRSGSANTYLFNSAGIAQIFSEMGLGANIVNFVNDIINRIFDLTWKSGVQIMLFLAGLHSIPDYLYEASALEGAHGWEQFWKITLPMLTPMILLNIIYSVVDMMSDYGNGIIRTIYSAMFDNVRFGFASAMSIIYFIVIILILGLVYLLIRRFVVYLDD